MSELSVLMWELAGLVRQVGLLRAMGELSGLWREGVAERSPPGGGGG